VPVSISGWYAAPYHTKDWIGQCECSRTLFVIRWLKENKIKKKFTNVNIMEKEHLTMYSVITAINEKSG